MLAISLLRAADNIKSDAWEIRGDFRTLSYSKIRAATFGYLGPFCLELSLAPMNL